MPYSRIPVYGESLDDNWNLGIRSSASYAGAVFRLGLSITGPDAPIFNPLPDASTTTRADGGRWGVGAG